MNNIENFLFGTGVPLQLFRLLREKR